MNGNNFKRFLGFLVFVSLVFIVLIHFYLTRMTVNPYYGKVFYRLGKECQDKCGLDKQLYYFKKAVFYDPNLSDAYYSLAFLYGKKNDHQNEIECYKKLTQLDHANWEAYLKSGAYYAQAKEPDYALRYLWQAERIRKYVPDTSYDMVKIHYYLAKAYDQKEMYKEAINYYIVLISWNFERLKEVCERIWQISKLPGQEKMVLEQIEKLRDSPKQLLEQEQMVRYIKTGQVPEFIK